MVQPIGLQANLEAWDINNPPEGHFMKRWLLIGGGLLVLFIGAVFFLFSSLDTLIVKAIETGGSEIIQTKVSVTDVELSPVSGKVALRGLKIGNPQNFESENAFELGEISLKVDLATLTESTIVIKEIIIADPEVTYETNGKESNFDIIQKNIDSYRKSSESSPSSGDAKESKSEDEEEIKLIIETLIIRNSRVNVITPQLEKPMIVKLATLEIKDIGKDKGGVSPGDAVREILGALRQSVVKAVTIVNLDGAEEILKGTTAEIRDQMEKGVADSKDIFDKTGDELGGAVKDFFGN